MNTQSQLEGVPPMTDLSAQEESALPIPAARRYPKTQADAEARLDYIRQRALTGANDAIIGKELGVSQRTVEKLRRAAGILYRARRGDAQTTRLDSMLIADQRLAAIARKRHRQTHTLVYELMEVILTDGLVEALLDG